MAGAEVLFPADDGEFRFPIGKDSFIDREELSAISTGEHLMPLPVRKFLALPNEQIGYALMSMSGVMRFRLIAAMIKGAHGVFKEKLGDAYLTRPGFKQPFFFDAKLKILASELFFRKFKVIADWDLKFGEKDLFGGCGGIEAVLAMVFEVISIAQNKSFHFSETDASPQEGWTKITEMSETSFLGWWLIATESSKLIAAAGFMNWTCEKIREAFNHVIDHDASRGRSYLTPMDWLYERLENLGYSAVHKEFLEDLRKLRTYRKFFIIFDIELNGEGSFFHFKSNVFEDSKDVRVGRDAMLKYSTLFKKYYYLDAFKRERIDLPVE